MSAEFSDNPRVRAIAVGSIVGSALLAGVAVFVGTEDASLPDVPEVASLPPLEIAEIHSELDYPLDQVAADKRVPPIFIKSLDVDLNRIRDVKNKKAAFFKVFLPVIARENDRIRKERATIVAEPGDVPSKIYRKYDVDPGNLDELLKRVDIIPASLVLAQAALESGWGTSRFARKGNNFFGMRTYNMDAPGMEPLHADGFKVMVFKSISSSVRAYIRNLNTHSAYKSLRDARAKMRDAGEKPSGRKLSHFLTSYSEIPEQYGGRLRSMMDRNKLDRFDGVSVAER